MGLITPTSTVKDSSSFLHVEKMDSEVANSKYHSLFFILCQPQHKAQEGGDKLHSAGRGLSDREGHQPPDSGPLGKRMALVEGLLRGATVHLSALSQTWPQPGPSHCVWPPPPPSPSPAVELLRVFLSHDVESVSNRGILGSSGHVGSEACLLSRHRILSLIPPFGSSMSHVLFLQLTPLYPTRHFPVSQLP